MPAVAATQLIGVVARSACGETMSDSIGHRSGREIDDYDLEGGSAASEAQTKLFGQSGKEKLELLHPPSVAQSSVGASR
jgi:hypothetical protein